MVKRRQKDFRNFRKKAKPVKPGARKTGQRQKAGRAHKRQRKYTPEETRILSVLKKQGEKEVASRQLLKLSGVKDKTLFYTTLRILERNGDVKIDKKHKVSLAPQSKEISAKIISLSEGFGFARPEEVGEDIFVHGSDLNGAFLGDSVLLNNVKRREKGFSGAVKRIEEKAKGKYTGTVHFVQGRSPYITADGALRYELIVKNGDLGGAKDGDKVLIEPLQDAYGEWRFAKITQIFGNAESAKVCADAIIERSGIPFVFPEEVLEEAKIVSAEKITEQEIAGRLDLRKKNIFTIDGADAKDLDDAISVEKIKNGYKLMVHIADVSHYVRENTELDKEAFRRGTSVYFADRVIPMLPEVLSNGVCSLSLGTEKLTMTASVYFDKVGNITKYAFDKSIIVSKVRGVYSEVNEIFAGTASKELLKKYSPIKRGLENARELADLLKEKAKAGGKMELESGEIRFVLDENGICVDIQPRTTGESEELIEQLMIAANSAAAMFSKKHNLPFLYRVHGKPQPERVTDLCILLDRLGISCTELKKGVPKPADFDAVLKRTKGTTLEEMVSRQILRTMEKAKYSAEETGHFGLALKDYSHFTSPIRRYPDTSIHRILTAFLTGMGSEEIQRRYGVFAEESASESSKNEVRAVTGERDAEDCYVAEYMKAHIGEEHTGVISGVTSRGIFVRIENGAEGFVRISDFEGADYLYDGSISFRDRRSGKILMVGDILDIKIASASVASGKVDFLSVTKAE
jgi:ribonuclease R